MTAAPNAIMALKPQPLPYVDPETQPSPQERSDLFAGALLLAIREDLSIRDLRSLLRVFHEELMAREQERDELLKDFDATSDAPSLPVRRSAHVAEFLKGGDTKVRIFIDQRPSSIEDWAQRLAANEECDEEVDYRLFAQAIVQSLAPDMSLMHLDHLIKIAQAEYDEQETRRQLALNSHSQIEPQ